jgi:AcrR family transcriptional regulator
MNETGIDLSPKARRILDVTRELLLRRGSRGLTIAEIASVANVGKGTLYLYWATKEDLLAELFVHDSLAEMEEIEGLLADNPATVLPHRLFPTLHRIKLKHPFVIAAQTRDHELLRLVEGHPLIRALLDTTNVRWLITHVLTVLREHGLIRGDLALGQQIYASLAMLEGFFQLPRRPGTMSAVVEVDGEAVLGTVARQLLEPNGQANEIAIAEAAASVRRFMMEGYDAALTRVLRSRRTADEAA